MRGIVYRCFVYDVVQELGCNEEEMIRRLIFVDFIASSIIPIPTYSCR